VCLFRVAVVGDCLAISLALDPTIIKRFFRFSALETRTTIFELCRNHERRRLYLLNRTTDCPINAMAGDNEGVIGAGGKSLNTGKFDTPTLVNHIQRSDRQQAW